MADLFSALDHLQKIPVLDAEVYYLSHLELGISEDAVLNKLIAETPWRQENVLIWGKSVPQPRLVAWYGDRDSGYTYSGITLTPLLWTDVLLTIRRQVETVTKAAFNSVLLNYYRDHQDSMGFHSDDEPELGQRPIIASLSFGEERTFVLKHKLDRLLKPVRLRLASGSLLLMKGETQKNWKHGIEKSTRTCGPRVNLTFRRINPK